MLPAAKDLTGLDLDSKCCLYYVLFMSVHIRLNTLFILLVALLAVGLMAQPVTAEDTQVLDGVDPMQERAVSEQNRMNMGASAFPSKEPEYFEIDNPPDVFVEPEEPSTRILPIFGEQAREKGYALPLPFGLGITGLVQQQAPKIEELKFGIGTATDKPGISINGSKVTSASLLARGDVWLFPFLNLYGFGGMIRGNADISVNVDAFSTGGQNFDAFKFNIEGDYTGATGGVGMTLAGGYKEFFGTIDANHAKSRLDFLDGKIDVTTVTPRVGMRIESERYGKGSFWAGIMYIDLRERLHGSVDVNLVGPGSRTLAYDLYFTLDDPYTYLAGGMWELSQKVNAMVEVGVGGRNSLMGSFTYRF